MDGGLAYLKQLAYALKDKPKKVIIEGHTDNTPINSDINKLAPLINEAAEVTSALQKFGILGEHGCRGFGASRPIVQNGDSPSGHKQNRRGNYVKPLIQEDNVI